MKTRRISRTIASLAMAGVMAFTGAGAYAEEAIGTMTEPRSLDVYCLTNDDPEFPFNFDIDVSPESIRFVELEEPIYGFESLLDEEALVFDVKFSLKDEYLDFDGYRFGVYNADYTEEIASEYLESGEVFTIPGLALGTGYKIDMTLESETLTAYYGGQFVIQAELDSTLAVDLFYQLADMEGEGAPYATESYENDSRNSTQPDILMPDRPMNASTTKGDIDLFSFLIPHNMTGSSDDDEEIPGVAMVEFSITGGVSTITASFSDENGVPLKVFEPTSIVGVTKYYRINNFPIRSSVIVKITSNSNTTVDYKLKATRKYVNAWYGQFVSKDDNGVYWNDDKLYNLKISAYDTSSDVMARVTRSFFVDEKESNETHWMKRGCGIVASAMILRNLGATTNNYDFRTDYSGELQADPFTVMLANSKVDGTKLKSNPTYLYIPNGTSEPDNLVSDETVAGFKMKNFVFIDNGNNPVSLDKISAAQETALRNAIEKYNYVLIYFNGKDFHMHFMVLTELKSGSESFADRAIVFDPAGRTYSAGAGEGFGVRLSQTAWYKNPQYVAKFSSARYYY